MVAASTTLSSPNVFKGGEVQDDIERIKKKIKEAKTPQARQKWIERLASMKKFGKLLKAPKKTPKTKKSLLKHETPKQPPGFTLGIGKGGSSGPSVKYPKRFDVVGAEGLDFPMSLEEDKFRYGTGDWRGWSDPLYDPKHDEYGFKHGGRIKKAKKRKPKRAALRGHRKELRGG